MTDTEIANRVRDILDNVRNVDVIWNATAPENERQEALVEITFQNGERCPGIYKPHPYQDCPLDDVMLGATR